METEGRAIILSAAPVFRRSQGRALRGVGLLVHTEINGVRLRRKAFDEGEILLLRHLLDESGSPDIQTFAGYQAEGIMTTTNASHQQYLGLGIDERVRRLLH
jgi:hypothetical protein